MEANQSRCSARWSLYASDTIDTFSMSVKISIRDHSLYVKGRRFAHYRWGVTPDSDSKDDGEAFGAGKEDTKLDCQSRECVRGTGGRASSSSLCNSGTGSLLGSKGGSQ